MTTPTDIAAPTQPSATAPTVVSFEFFHTDYTASFKVLKRVLEGQPEGSQLVGHKWRKFSPSYWRRTDNKWDTLTNEALTHQLLIEIGVAPAKVGLWFEHLTTVDS